MKANYNFKEQFKVEFFPIYETDKSTVAWDNRIVGNMSWSDYSKAAVITLVGEPAIIGIKCEDLSYVRNASELWWNTDEGGWNITGFKALVYFVMEMIEEGRKEDLFPGICRDYKISNPSFGKVEGLSKPVLNFELEWVK